jgi:hypothetical protein
MIQIKNVNHIFIRKMSEFSCNMVVTFMGHFVLNPNASLFIPFPWFISRWTSPIMVEYGLIFIVVP